ncbi:hypothetical protein, partial [Flavobacterium sp. AG291]|uniref:hypothetical protein n=1 Tax=Flavobacterium sp. AG291 TaxID=2184000 RepID=UPI001F241BF4
FFLFFRSELSFSKRLQKYNFFSFTQAFLKKKFFLKNSADSEFQKLFQHPDLSVWEGKDKIFFLLLPSFFQNFFRLFSTPIYKAKKCASCFQSPSPLSGVQR